jgi:hypothetical protein
MIGHALPIGRAAARFRRGRLISKKDADPVR